MAKEQGGIDKSKSIEDLHHLRLMALLDELVQDKGARKAAADLDVDHRTLTASLESGRLSRRMRVALNQALLAGTGSPAGEQRQRNDELAGRLERVEGQVDEMGKEMNEGLSAVQGEVRALRKDHARDLQRVESRLAKVAGGDGAAGSASASVPLARGGKSKLRREYPELVTLEPAADDEDVFGGVWPLIQEWRGTQGDPPQPGEGAVLAGHGRTVPGGGAGVAGRARDDPAPGPVSAAGLRPERADQLAPEGPGRHPGGFAKAQAPGVGRARPDPGALAQVAVPAADVSVNSLAKIAGGVLQDLF